MKAETKTEPKIYFRMSEILSLRQRVTCTKCRARFEVGPEDELRPRCPRCGRAANLNLRRKLVERIEPVEEERASA